MSWRRRTAQWAALLALPAATACVAGRGAPATAPSSLLELDSHITGFAMAYCLRSLGGKGLPEPDARVMHEQGERWGQVVVEQSRGDIFSAFEKMRPALNAALEATPMAQVKDEASAGSVPAPVFYCAQLLHQPAVVGAMAEARATLAPDYAGE